MVEELPDGLKVGLNVSVMTLCAPSLSRRSWLAGAGAWMLWTGLSPAAKAAPLLTPLTMQLDWQLTTQFAGLMVAESTGLYRQRGLTVTLKPATAGLSIPEKVAADPTMLGCVEQSILLAAQVQGVKVSAIATMLQSSPLALISPPSAPLKTPQDLIGKRIGLHEDGLKALDLILTQNGIDPQRVRRTLMPYGQTFEPLTTQRFDAIQCYALDEPLDYRRQTGLEPVILKFSDYGFDAYAQVIIASDPLLAEAPDTVQAFLAATFAGWQQALADIPATARLITQRYADSNVPDIAYQAQTLQRLRPYVLPNQAKPGTLSPTRWQRAAQQLADCGLIDTVPARSLWSQAWTA
ncbi:MAG: ABC transporter substrate-binding protein [Cyanobacteria bacterium J06554_6]